jgi:radial spoke head protein 9
LEDDLVIFSANFLDSISEDIPQGSWSMQIDNKVKNVTVRSLKWLGYFAFHKLNSNQFGSAYIGDGIKNIDLSFMI